jgi:hypothetical protein
VLCLIRAKLIDATENQAFQHKQSMGHPSPPPVSHPQENGAGASPLDGMWLRVSEI